MGKKGKSQLLLQKMLRLMCRLIINMHVGPFHIRQGLKFHLQLLGNVVGGLQGVIAVHDDVDLDYETGTGGVGADGVDGCYEWGMGHRLFY